MVPEPISDRSIMWGRLGLVVTVLAWAGYVITTLIREYVDHGVQGMRFVSESTSYLIVVTVLTFSAFMYLLARQGAMVRMRAHRRVPRPVLDAYFHTHLPTMTVLVPSYREDPRVIRKTLLSAALQEYPYLRVVLLLDDPPHPTEPEHVESLRETRRLAAELQAWLLEPATRLTASLQRFEERADTAAEPTPADLRTLAADYRWAAEWLRAAAAVEEVVDHVDEFFVHEVLLALAVELEDIEGALVAAVADGASIGAERILQLYRRLAWTFRAELTTFERKLYASLSQEANKAMNLNSYIGLMGGTFRCEQTPGGTLLTRAGASGELVVPDSDYVLTLDADSVLLREYCLRLVHFLEQPEHAHVAVAQTPYSAFPGAPTRLERIAGATTDLQHIVHQGMTHHAATFWVGANAVLRKTALEDLVEIEHERGHEVRRYIQDRTVIEDTESSIDLGVHGWSLFNYPERLSYSATPPDFGSLCIQRRRWANGGLLILPKLWRQVHQRRRRLESGRAPETLLRLNYMASTAWSSIGLVFLLAYPYDSRLLSPFVLLAALPYFLAMAGDLKHCGYKRLDVLRIYGFNLMLLPVNLAGVLKSVQQGVTGRKIPFARTPKVKDRTAAPVLFVTAPVLIAAFSVFTLWRDAHAGNWGNAAFAAFNAVLVSYAMLAFIGVRNALADVWLGSVARLYVDPARSGRGRRRRATSEATPTPAAAAMPWQEVLGVNGSTPATAVSVRREAVAAEAVAADSGASNTAAADAGRGLASEVFSTLISTLGDVTDMTIGLDGPDMVLRLRLPGSQPDTEPSEQRGVELEGGQPVTA